MLYLQVFRKNNSLCERKMGMNLTRTAPVENINCCYYWGIVSGLGNLCFCHSISHTFPFSIWIHKWYSYTEKFNLCQKNLYPVSHARGWLHSWKRNLSCLMRLFCLNAFQHLTKTVAPLNVLCKSISPVVWKYTLPSCKTNFTLWKRQGFILTALSLVLMILGWWGYKVDLDQVPASYFVLFGLKFLEDNL